MTDQFLERAARVVDTVREKKPLVDCITNVVTVNDCANILLSFGASPAMIDVFEESYDFAGISSALYLNLGTFGREQEIAAIQAVLAAKQAGIPVVVDPVGCAAIPKRIRVLEHLHKIAGVDMIKGNMGEIMALDGRTAQVKGVDSSGEVHGIEEAAINVAKQYGCTVAATGKVDVVTDGALPVHIHNGVEMLTNITGAGCMVGALCGATAAAAKIIGENMFIAAIAGILAMGIAGEQAAEKTQLPGSYRVALMDSVYTLTGKTTTEKGKLQ
jgi:hydroxyethylthiazole kinase